MNNYFSNWNTMRLIRLALGIVVAVQGFIAKDWALVALGGFFAAMPLLNIGCCSTGNCRVSTKENTKKTQDISYEEVR